MNTQPQVNELLEAVLSNLPIKIIHPIHKAMLEEACEHALKNKKDSDTFKELENAVHFSFRIINPVFQSTMKAALEYADSVIIDYRGVKEVITSESSLLKSVN